MSTEERADQRVVVTGGAGGIGFAIAEAFVRDGAQVVILDRAAEELQKATDRLDGVRPSAAHGIACDLADPAAIVSAAASSVEHLGGIDVLVNNAGIGHSVALVESTDKYIDDVLNINLRAVLLLTREVARVMLDQGSGTVINISSQAAKRGYAGITQYSASKAGVLGFTISLAMELAPTVRVNAICPGMVATPMMQSNIEQTSREKGISYDEAYQEWTAPIPLERLQQPEDIAKAVLFLASSDASEITGEALNVSGGLVMW